MKRKRARFKIGPELTVALNRLAGITEYAKPGQIFTLFGENKWGGLDSSDYIKICAKRYKELEERGYPEEWIQKDLERLTRSLAG